MLILTSMSRIPLQTLPTFRAVATLSNLRAAGEQLHLTHSAVSQQIRLLEEQLGFLLFDRRGRRVVLNAAGAALLQAVEPALAQIDEGMRAAALASTGTEQRLRITVSPSFAQHWLMPRMAHWRALHPGMAVELHTSQQAMDLPREGFHAAVRQGKGPWRGLEGSRLIDSQQVVVASPAMAQRLAGTDPATWIHEPLLGTSECWEAWFALAGHPCRIQPVAVFNDMGLMLQATEQGLGIALGRELVAADALRAGRLVQLSPLALATEAYDAYWLVYPPEFRDWPPLLAFQAWLQSELQIAAKLLQQSRAPAG
jgi:LysR family glycine cleavage system transcriptional activator